MGQLGRILSKSPLEIEFWEDLEEALILTDMGAGRASLILDDLKERVLKDKESTGESIKKMLADEIASMLDTTRGDLLDGNNPKAIILVGINGTGKTTTIAKLANLLKEQGKSVVLAAADTFRAAATEQLAEWARRLKVDIIAHKTGGDPAAVAFDAINAAKARGKRFILIDTAGRLHTNQNLMAELKKIKRVAIREMGEESVKVLMIIDAITGQNGIAQAKIFNEALDLDGIILTKIDGTAKGGVAVAVSSELGVPIVYTGSGEGLVDLIEFNSKEFAAALLDI
ncbi:MAG: signal recognition particle-docking protein FtsY [Actinomycetota bacterium]|nr:signal recognition particle-docking protein FtsY [Actinomycetota bacterium]